MTRNRRRILHDPAVFAHSCYKLSNVLGITPVNIESIDATSAAYIVQVRRPYGVSLDLYLFAVKQGTGAFSSWRIKSDYVGIQYRATFYRLCFTIAQCLPKR